MSPEIQHNLSPKEGENERVRKDVEAPVEIPVTIQHLDNQMSFVGRETIGEATGKIQQLNLTDDTKAAEALESLEHHIGSAIFEVRANVGIMAQPTGGESAVPTDSNGDKQRIEEKRQMIRLFGGMSAIEKAFLNHVIYGYTRPLSFSHKQTEPTQEQLQERVNRFIASGRLPERVKEYLHQIHSISFPDDNKPMNFGFRRLDDPEIDKLWHCAQYLSSNDKEITLHSDDGHSLPDEVLSRLVKLQGESETYRRELSENFQLVADALEKDGKNESSERKRAAAINIIYQILDSHDKDLSDKAVDLILENIDYVKSGISNTKNYERGYPDFHRISLVEVLTKAMETLRKDIREIGVKIAIEYFDKNFTEEHELRASQLEKYGRVNGKYSDELLKQSLIACDDADFDLLCGIIKKDGTFPLVDIIAEMIAGDDDRLPIRGFILCDLKGLPVEQIKAYLPDWKRGNLKDKRRAVGENFEMYIELELEHPGITASLTKDCGIVNFGRYPKDILISQFRQLQEKEKFDRPYGVVVFPKDDHNGAFSTDAWRFGKLKQQIQSNKDSNGKDIPYELRFFEADSKVDLVRYLIKLGKWFPSHKISFAIIGGHGEKDGIHFGKGDLLVDDLSGKSSGRLGDFFESNPSIVLASCSTGQSGGIGEKISRVLGAHVSAPNKPTGVENYIISTDENGQIHLDAKFSDAEDRMVYSHK
ncbi:MAG: hypothetical protein A2538_01370 [Candidatus Magasanikbacteria bacterium RIFOXYD2_FULL_41_14]|uniref:Uncharacterized protein n=1 Tax=Candidatus Magasanikbacteria bacterium RIFOXYD2_FULL_41_14 TaxID=1798709 RepID=A0A1F6PGD0_9BACT|nr:MAG: hypothetical protein A2538_01370 [Candidatus Magasanikbacteria bacterium RIFOXYD2_FULL_41_14]